MIGHATTNGSRTEMENMDAKHFVIAAMIRTATAMIGFQKNARNISVIVIIKIAKNIGSLRMLESMVVENHANIVLRKGIESKRTILPVTKKNHICHQPYQLKCNPILDIIRTKI